MSKQSISLWDYLEETGVLEHGTDKEIEKAKKDYRQLYHKWYKRKRRVFHPETTISWGMEDYQNIQAKAEEHNRSIPAFIKEATLGYIDKRYVVPNQGQVTYLIQILSNCYSEILLLSEQEHPVTQEQFQNLLHRIQTLENTIDNIFSTPLILEKAIKKAVAYNPDYANQLLSILINSKT